MVQAGGERGQNRLSGPAAFKGRYMVDDQQAGAWRAEFRATLSLAWPLVLTNITQMLINFTDVVLLARVGPDALAASAIGSGIVVAMMLFGIGLVTAASPLIASEIGRRAHAVREVRRTVRQAFWAATLLILPMLVFLWFTGDLMRLAGQPERLAAGHGDPLGQRAMERGRFAL